MKQFFKHNKWALIIGFGIYVLFLKFNFSGSRMFNCISTEKYNSTGSGSRGSVNHFYHK